MSTKTDIQLWCIHGNLQRPSVWRPFEGSFYYVASEGSEEKFPLHLQLENLWESTEESFWGWARTFCLKVQYLSYGTPQILMGYSQGGRLALHAVVHNPELWRGAIVIGADAGFTNDSEREARLKKDQEWGQRFLSEPWDKLLAEWDEQSVFSGRPNLTSRNEHDFSREAICRLFNTFSKGRQEDLRPAVARLSKPPILFLSGEADKKYCDIGSELSKICPVVKHIIIESAAHRVPWENPEPFIREVQQFISFLHRKRKFNPYH